MHNRWRQYDYQPEVKIYKYIKLTRVSAPRCAIQARSTREANFDKVINSLRSESFRYLTGPALACEQFSIPGGRSESRENAQASTKPREAKEKDSLQRSVKVFHNCLAQRDEAKYHWLKNDPRAIDSFFPVSRSRVFVRVRLTQISRATRDSPKRRAWSQTIQAPNCPLLLLTSSGMTTPPHHNFIRPLGL